MQSLPQDDGLFGAFRLSTDTTEYNQKIYLIQRMLAQVNVATLVSVKGVDTAAGTVDVLPLVGLVDGAGQVTRHATVYGLPYIRIQGGSGAFICDPVVGDIGLCVFSDSDLSAVKASKTQGPPGSLRKFSMSDGVYIGGWNPNAAPSTYVKVSPSGVDVKGDTSVDGNVNTTGVYKVDGQQVVTNRQANIPAPVGGSTIDAQARMTIGSILSLLSTHGLMS